MNAIDVDMQFLEKNSTTKKIDNQNSDSFYLLII